MKNKILREYCTPDNLSLDVVNASWIDGAYPFIETNKGIVYGYEGQKHMEMKNLVIAKLTNTSAEIVNAIENETYEYYTDEDGYEHYIIDENEDNEIDEDKFNQVSYFLHDDGQYELMDYVWNFGRIWPDYGDNYESYASLWLNNRFDEDGVYDYCDNGSESAQFNVRNSSSEWSGKYVPSKLDKSTIETLYKVFKHFSCDLDNSYVCIGENIISIKKLMSGEENIAISAEDLERSKEERIKHLLSPEEKWKETEGFRNTINTKNAEKLAMHDADGNFKGEMPMAQYNALRHPYGESIEYSIHKILHESIFSNLLLEAKSPEEVFKILCYKYGQELGSHGIKGIMEIDPTKKYSYTQWACKALMNPQEEEFGSPYGYTAIVLEKLFKTAQEHNDFQLTKFSTVSEAQEGLEEYLGKFQYSVVYEDERWIIYVPETYEAERYIVWQLYEGASWCTAANSEQGVRYFNNYNEGGNKLYINANKETNSIFQYSPKTGEFNDSDNYGVDNFEEIGITEGAMDFYKEKLGFDIVAEAKRQKFDEDAEEIGDTGVYFFEGELWTDFEHQISNGNNSYTSYISDFYSSNCVILAPHAGRSDTYDIFVNQDQMTGEDKGWHLEYENVDADEWSDGGDGFYCQIGDYFGFFETSEGWYDCIGNVKYAEAIDYANPDDFWVLTKKDGTKSLYSKQLYEYDNEWTQEEMEKYGLLGFAEMVGEVTSKLINDSGEGWIEIDRPCFDKIKEMLRALNYINVNVKEDDSDNSQLIIYDKGLNMGEEEQNDWFAYAKSIGEELGVDYGVEGDTPYILIPKNTPREELTNIHNFIRNRLGGHYKMLPDYDENTFKVSIKPKEEYSIAENIKNNFNVLLEKISKNYNADKILE